MPQILKSNFEIFISKWLPQKKDVKNLELWILISWDGAMVDYFDLNFSNTFHDSYAWIKFHFLCRNPFKRNRLLAKRYQEVTFGQHGKMAANSSLLRGGRRGVLLARSENRPNDC